MPAQSKPIFERRILQNRRTAPSINRRYCAGKSGLLIEKKRPGDGCKPLLAAADVKQFIHLLPDWNELST